MHVHVTCTCRMYMFMFMFMFMFMLFMFMFMFHVVHVASEHLTSDISYSGVSDAHRVSVQPYSWDELNHNYGRAPPSAACR